jgi:hypothetical protein
MRIALCYNVLQMEDMIMDETFSLRIDHEMLAELKEWAQFNERPVSWLIRVLLADALTIRRQRTDPRSAAERAQDEHAAQVQP